MSLLFTVILFTSFSYNSYFFIVYKKSDFCRARNKSNTKFLAVSTEVPTPKKTARLL